jgi:hypothetical protein
MRSPPAEIVSRAEDYCLDRGQEIVSQLGYGVDGYVWRTKSKTVLKVFRHDAEFRQELSVYERLSKHQIIRLQGFSIPALLHYDRQRWILELSFVFPPFLLDFAAATLDHAPSGFDPDDPDWVTAMQARYGRDWPDVKRLLDALRQYGIHFTDVHLGNIRLRP